ncbi:MFS transporter [Xylophilus sp. GW821-FHT01B05]
MKNTRFGMVYGGWRVLAGSFFCAAVVVGFTTYIFGMFVMPVTKEFGISRANFNSGMIAFLMGGGLMAPIVGNLLDRYSGRLLSSVGGILFGGSLMLISRVDSLWLMLALIFLPLTFGAATCGVLGANTLVVSWFQRRRGRALGILALSTSFGGFVSQPVTALLIESFGWRDALFLIGLGAVLIFFTVISLTARTRPTTAEAGYADEFSPSVQVNQPKPGISQERSWSNRELLRNRNFWFLTIGLALLFGTDQAVLVSQASFFQDTGLDLKTTALLISVKTISAVGGKLAIGFLSDKVNLRLLYAYVAGSNMLLMCIYILQPSFVILLISVALLGVAVGGVFPLWATLIAWLFGGRSYGKVMGTSMIIMQPFAVVALRFIGEVYDRTGSYHLAFGTFIPLVFTSVVLIGMLKPERDDTANAEAALPEDRSPQWRATAATDGVAR